MVSEEDGSSIQQESGANELKKKRDLVLKELKAPVFDPRGKFKPNWVGPYVIKTLFSGGTTKLMDVDGEELCQVSNQCKKKNNNK